MTTINNLAACLYTSKRPDFVSDNYGFIPTVPLISMIQDKGWELVKVKTRKAKDPNKQVYAKHQLIFENQAYKDGEVAARIYITNSHDRSSAFTFNLGFLRFVCDNGLIVGDAIGTQFKVYHSGRDLAAQVNDRLLEALNAVPRLMAMRQALSTYELSTSQETAIVTEVTQAVSKIRGFDIDSSSLTIVRREQDAPSNAWTLLNILQENSLNKLRGITTTSNGDRRLVKARSVKSLDVDYKLNTTIFPIVLKHCEGLNA